MKLLSFWQWNILWGIGAALFFGLGAPLYKVLVKQTPPLMISGLTYAIAGLFFLSILALFREKLMKVKSKTNFTFKELVILGGMVLFGGILAPLSLLAGILSLPAHQASILLNSEVLFTILIAVFIFKEALSFVGWLGVIVVIAGTVVINLIADHIPKFTGIYLGGEGLLLLACLFWAIDNNLTQLLSNKSSILLAGIKSLAGGTISLLLALILGMLQFPSWNHIPLLLLVGICSIGLSLLLFILSLRYVGTTRTAALFATAPVFGFLSSLLLLQEPVGLGGWIALVMMTGGVLLISLDQHEHEHEHLSGGTETGSLQSIRHTHPHTHDPDHKHSH